MITGNDASAENAINKPKQDLAQMGGGVVVRGGSNLTLPTFAVIDNNAALAGDDLCAEQGKDLVWQDGRGRYPYRL